MNKRTVGTEYEIRAKEYLKEHGVRITSQNFRIRLGEIDLIGYDGQSLVFFEVKYRRSNQYGAALSAVDYKKQKQICLVSNYYCTFHHIPDRCQKRFDVIAIEGNEITWVKDAFSYQS